MHLLGIYIKCLSLSTSPSCNLQNVLTHLVQFIILGRRLLSDLQALWSMWTSMYQFSPLSASILVIFVNINGLYGNEIPWYDPNLSSTKLVQILFELLKFVGLLMFNTNALPSKPLGSTCLIFGHDSVQLVGNMFNVMSHVHSSIWSDSNETLDQQDISVEPRLQLIWVL